jgi:hypothetical protein
MLLKKTTTFLTIFFIGLFLGLRVISASGQDDISSRAFQLFDEKNYAQAEPLFKRLIDEKPELLLLYYYYGACRTENHKYSEYDLIQLLNANPNESPAKINYYLGIQYQALNNWEQAIRYYNIFKLRSSPEEQIELNLAEKIQQCYNQENPFSNLNLVLNEPPATINSEVNTILNESSIFSEFQDIPEPSENNIVGESEIPVTVQPTPAFTEKRKTIEFRVNSQITYFSPEQFKTEEGKSFFEKGQEKQVELNAASSKIESLRNQYQLARGSEERNRIGQEIIPLETEIYFIKEEATRLILQAENAENNYWRNVPEEEIEDFITEQEKYITIDKGNFEKQAETDFDTEFMIDPSLLFQNRAEIIKNEKPKSDELIYKIQIGAYSRALPANIDRLFKKLAVLRRIENYTDERGVVVYTTGNLTNYEDAERMRLQVKQEGAEDAIVVPYFNGKRITLEEAKKIENNL